MDPASLDPRLRETGEDSIVVHDSTQQLIDTDSEASESPPQQLHTSTTSPSFTPQTPSGNVFPPTADTPNTAGATPQDPNDPKRPRACEACRGLKVKCEPDPSNPDGPCKRCAKAGRSCVVTQPTRKRQKKTDSRVAELEKKIDALTASLQASRGSGSGSGSGGGASQPPAPIPTPAPQRSFEEDQHTGIAREWGPLVLPAQDNGSKPERPSHQPQLVMAGQKRKFTETRYAPSDGPKEPSASRLTTVGRHHSDVVDRGIITMEEASVLFRRYTDHMATHLPAVVFPQGTSAAEVRKTKPILFLSVMSVASSETPNIQRHLVKELMQIFADKIIITGEKSLELVQAIMISVIWYFPPEHFEELKFYQMVHLAAVMAIDIGLGRKKNNPKSRLIPYTWRDHPFRKQPLPDPTTIEARRTWLAAYFLASNVAMALHRPNLIRWQAFMTECMDILESSPDAAPTDRYLCHLVWTHRLAEEVGIQFSMDDPSVFINITEQKVQYALRGFERDLAKYSENIPQEDRQSSLLLSFHVLNLYMHEIALYVDKSNEEYRAPTNAEALRDPIPGLGDSLTSAHISALSSCLTAIDGIFETFLALDTQSIRCLPIFNFVRVAYAVVVLIKVYFSASSPNSELGKVINKDNMKVAEYLDKLLEKFRETAASDKSRPAGKFLVVLVMLRGWFHKQGQTRSQGDQQIDPALKPAQALQANSNPPHSRSQENESASNSSHERQRHPQPPQSHQSEYNPANTPLQLLSEIATGNGLSHNSQACGPPSSGVNASPYSAWMGHGAQQPYMYDPNTGMPTSTAGGDTEMGAAGQPLIPWMNGPFGSDMDYTSMGDGFEQAMGLTLTGFGGGSPGDSASYENSMRMMTQNDAMLMSMMDGFSQNNGNPFGF
ncbi:hypothetical protein F5Y19DRAFT_10790 [Xylariaceae sp. FL1651]|nr:hypothetical protein F5Y19DRAFT_10790 [Xylariaceae sp. FL1651]